ncbi:hypothetical protein S7335_4100 [Synechococcus sp. PCC 7335]|uniref:hypothetical protein n=1 Tax=Synechococcus sp. (strain ATCC 29403 / PCC 7335) TaxID=91464 RepID=UPI00017ECAFB|nr:hypothetical protein [Synechococcus sp. PCC 7335]EDX86396.1 hypothetical protein S7335_4100 [Synechococcus sp. PCC 7335]
MHQLFRSFVLMTVSGLAIAPPASAVDFVFTTVQERPGGVAEDEVVEIDDVTRNFQELQRERLNQETEAVEGEDQPSEAAPLEGEQADALKPSTQNEGPGLSE